MLVIFIGVSKSFASINVKGVSMIIRLVYLNFAQTSDEIENTMVGFYKISKFPQRQGFVPE